MRPFLLVLLSLASSFAFATDAEDHALQFIRCSFVLVKLAGAPMTANQAEQIKTGATVFFVIGAPNATSRDFVMKNVESVSDSFARELLRFGPGVALNPESIAFLIQEESKCKALYKEHQARYFSK